MSHWERFSADVYLDRRYRNWIISEEMGDVRFLPEVGVVMVHRVRAEHIVRELLVSSPVGAQASRGLPVTTRPEHVSPPMVLVRRTVPTPARALAPPSRWRIFTGWLGLGTATAVFVAALAVRLDDAALLLALSLFVWGGRLILDDAPLPSAGAERTKGAAHRRPLQLRN
jgi:hypothetical protein